MTPCGKRVICFTGNFGHYYTRAVAKEDAERIGYQVTGSVGKHCDIVVYGSGAGSKLDKARALGIRTMTRNEWHSHMYKPRIYWSRFWRRWDFAMRHTTHTTGRCAVYNFTEMMVNQMNNALRE